MKKITPFKNRFLHLVLLLVAMLATSCTMSRHYSGEYTIKRVYPHNVYAFYEIKGKYIIKNDTLKIGDKIYIKSLK